MKYLKILIYFYFLIASGFVIKFNYDFAKQNSFTEWLFFGEIVPTLKAFIWPYYFFSNEKKDNKSNAQENFKTLREFSNSLNFIQSAFSIKEQNVRNSESISIPEIYNESNSLRRKALIEAKKVSLKELEIMTSPEVSDSYKNEFILGLELYFEAMADNDFSKLEKSSILLNKFGEKYQKWRSK